MILELRPLGRSGLTVSAFGFGGGPIGNLRRAISDADATATVDAAWDAGARYFDTAPLYGHGRSEMRLGAALRRRPRDGFVLATKVGRLLRPPRTADFDRHGFVDTPDREIVYDYSRDGALRSFEESLARLKLDRVDVALIHDIDRWTHGDEQPRRFAEALDGAWRACRPQGRGHGQGHRPRRQRVAGLPRLRAAGADRLRAARRPLHAPRAGSGRGVPAALP
jgi:D-threo-aldose 1-dehydrogenase